LTIRLTKNFVKRRTCEVSENTAIAGEVGECFLGGLRKAGMPEE
jgi:hypothetical protein